jgi:CheY-like chemotaxis protein
MAGDWGNTFCIVNPRTFADGLDLFDINIVTARSGCVMKKILIVEDHAEVREPLAMLLRHEGFEARRAANGSEALALLALETPDLILLDMVMPKMDGLTLLELLRRDVRWGNIPVLLLTGVIEGSTLARARQLKVAGIIFKPKFNVEELVLKIREIVPESARVQGSGFGVQENSHLPATSDSSSVAS